MQSHAMHERISPFDTDCPADRFNRRGCVEQMERMVRALNGAGHRNRQEKRTG
jgi:hypothetical protein